jgi:predicted site-specific integrase-resolvase
MYSISEFAKKIGVTIQTLRDWDKSGKLKPAYRSKGNHRYYSENQLNEILQKKVSNNRINVGYVRVSANHQKDDLKRQYELMELFLAKQGKEFKIIQDIGSGINYNKKGLKELLKLIATNQCDTIFVLHKDRLLRFGYELIEEFAGLHNTKIIIINKNEEKTDEEEFVEDILNIIHVFSCRINGKRSHINKKIIKSLKNENI